MIPIFDAMLEEQQTQGAHWTPSRVRRRGERRAVVAAAAPAALPHAALLLPACTRCKCLQPNPALHACLPPLRR